MIAPTIIELLNDMTVLKALEDAWADSKADDAAQRHEEGGWIYMDLATGQLLAQRARQEVQRRSTLITHRSSRTRPSWPSSIHTRTLFRKAGSQDRAPPTRKARHAMACRV
jgi:hypothetical protein